jgi:hypothetical protein
MRRLLSGILALSLLALSQAAAAPGGAFPNSEGVLSWVYAYRAHPNPAQVPAAVHAMREHNLFREPEAAGFLTGFIAGVLAKNPSKAESLVARMFPMPAKEQVVIVKAIAYSGLPRWKELLTKFADRMPERQQLIDEYLSDKAQTLMNAPLEGDPGILYSLWGYYVATGQHGPVSRVIWALRWAKPKDEGGFTMRRLKSAVGWGGYETDPEKVLVGSAAKWTLASHAERDRSLVPFYRTQLEHQPDEIALPLKDVVAAAEAYEADRLRKEELAVVEEAKQRQQRLGTPLGRAGYAGSVALSGACVIAGVTGHIEIAVPCVIAGVVYTGTVRLLQNSQ